MNLATQCQWKRNGNGLYRFECLLHKSKKKDQDQDQEVSKEAGDSKYKI